jgi:hypothetical protein
MLNLTSYYFKDQSHTRSSTQVPSSFAKNKSQIIPLKQAVREQKVYRNVCDVVQLPRLTYKEITSLNKYQVKQFLEAAKKSKYYPAFILELPGWIPWFIPFVGIIELLLA